MFPDTDKEKALCCLHHLLLLILRRSRVERHLQTNKKGSVWVMWDSPELVYCVFKGALQLRMNRCGYIRFAHVHEQVSTKSPVVLILGDSKSNHVGAQVPFKKRPKILKPDTDNEEALCRIYNLLIFGRNLQ